MNRRHFLLTTTALAAGCAKKPEPVPPPPEPALSPEEQARVAAETAARDAFVKSLDTFRAGPGEKRETPKPAVDLTAVIPELKSQLRSAIRLHPRYGAELPPDDSKLGGRFLWPADDKWPLDATLKIPMVPVLQLREEHAPPPSQFPFRSVTDLMQLFWTARDPVANDQAPLGEYTALIVWRRRTELGGKIAEAPNLSLSFPSLVPVPCRLHPEWVGELPVWDVLKRTALRAKLQEWEPPQDAGGLAGPVYYDRFLAAAPGIKIGGWARSPRNAPNCRVCQWPMDYLLAIDSQEWSFADARRWRPVQDPDDSPGHRGACGLAFKGGRGVEVYVCRRCNDWPARALVV